MMQLNKCDKSSSRFRKWAGVFVIALTVVSFFVTLVFVPKIPQPSAYHFFADARTIWGIPNFSNVISNIPFLVVGVLGFLALRKQWNHVTGKEALVFLILYIGIFLIGIGSAYYHWSPTNNRLVWDRMPMTIVFMSLLSLTIMGRVNTKLGFGLLIPLLILGIFSVLYWHWTELSGRGDLRLYILVQFYSIFLIGLVILLFPGLYPPSSAFLWMLFFYGLAKLCEQFDLVIYNQLGEWVSGHTLKHIFAAISLYWTVIILSDFPGA